MFTIHGHRGKLTTWSAVAQIQPICYETAAFLLTASHPSTQISANAQKLIHCFAMSELKIKNLREQNFKGETSNKQIG